MAVIIYPITPRFAAEISDVDLSCPIGPSDLAAVNEAFAHYAVLIFPDQHLSQDQHLDFARHFASCGHHGRNGMRLTTLVLTRHF